MRILTIIAILMASPAFAGSVTFVDDDSVNPQQNQAQGQNQGQLQGQAQKQAQGQAQGQGQAQQQKATGIGVGLGVGKANAQQGQSQSSKNKNANFNANLNAAKSVSEGSSAGASAGANIGDTTSESSVGDITNSTHSESASHSGGNVQEQGDVTVEGDNSISSVNFERAASTAASVFAQVCQQGASGQVESGGFSIVNAEQFCNRMRAADAYQRAYLFEMQHGSAHCAEMMSIQHAKDEHADTCMNERAIEFYNLYHENLLEANALLDNRKWTSFIGNFFADLVIPIAVIAFLLI